MALSQRGWCISILSSHDNDNNGTKARGHNTCNWDKRRLLHPAQPQLLPTNSNGVLFKFSAEAPSTSPRPRRPSEHGTNVVAAFSCSRTEPSLSLAHKSGRRYKSQQLRNDTLCILEPRTGLSVVSTVQMAKVAASGSKVAAQCSTAGPVSLLSNATTTAAELLFTTDHLRQPPLLTSTATSRCDLMLWGFLGIGSLGSAKDEHAD